MTYDERVSNIISKLKQYKESHPYLTFDSIANATGLSLSTITRMFSEDSESHSFRADSIQAISEFLLEDENDDTALAIYRYNESYIKDLEDKLSQEKEKYEKRLEKDGGRYLFHSDFTEDPLPSSVVLSTDRKKIIVNKNAAFELHLYQVRAKNRSRVENILFEPFYPGFQSSLLDIYGILKDPPYSASSDAYRFSAMHTPRIRQYIRKRFHTIFPELFIQGVMNLDSFEEFYSMLHHMDSFQTLSLFRTGIRFV